MTCYLLWYQVLIGRITCKIIYHEYLYQSRIGKYKEIAKVQAGKEKIITKVNEEGKGSFEKGNLKILSSLKIQIGNIVWSKKITMWLDLILS